MTGPPRVLLSGAGGYGATYVAEIAELERAGRVELAGVCERSGLGGLAESARELVGDRPVSDDLPALLRRTAPDIGVVATPIHLHVPMARAVLQAGADLLLEKPPAATLDGWRQLVDAPGSPVRQVGFQSLGSQALVELRRLVVTGELGRVEHVGAWGAWLRTDDYYHRAPWAGRRTLAGTPVSDGVFTNPFAHALQTALAILGCTGAEDVVDVASELWRVRDIECDDTAWVRVQTRSGVPLIAAATLCSDEITEPVVVVRGTRADAVLHYTEDVLVVEDNRRAFGRTSPLQDLLAHRVDATALQSPLVGCGAFMTVLEALRTAPAPTPIPPAAVRRRGGARTVPGLATACRRAAVDGLRFAEAGRPW